MEIKTEDDFRAIHKRKMAAIEAERDYRECRLNIKDVAYWTNVVKTVGPLVTPSKRPCCYWKWAGTLQEYSREPPFIGKPPKYPIDMSARLMTFTEDVSQPMWIEPRTDLIEFALAFLEHDVMLYRSGYAKRHLIKRLKQCSLSDDQIDRIAALLRRSILNGTGVEEFRAYQKLASHLILDGKLDDFVCWLEETANGAVLTFGKENGPITELICEQFDDVDLGEMVSPDGCLMALPKWAVIYPEMLPTDPLNERMLKPSQKTKHSAFLMLTSIRRRQATG